MSFVRELKRVFSQIYKNLLQPDLVTNQHLRYDCNPLLALWTRSAENFALSCRFKESQWRLLYLIVNASELLFRLQLEDVEDKLKRLTNRKRLLAGHKLAHLNHFQIKHVIDEAKKQVDLTNEQEN